MEETVGPGVWLRSVTLDPEAAVEMRRLAADLLEQVKQIGDELAEYVLRELPDLRQPGDPTWTATVRRASRANVGAILSLLADDPSSIVGRIPVDARAVYERQAERDDGLGTVMRVYLLGIAGLWQIWARHVAAHVDDAQRLYVILATSLERMTAYEDGIAADAAARWRETRRRKQRGLDRNPADLVRGALAGGSAEDLAQLGYDVDAHHVAIALPPEGGEHAAEALAARLRARLAADTVLLSHDAASVVWVARVRDVFASVTALVVAGGPAGMSNAHAGVVGFRMCHREAVDALRFGRLRGVDGVTRHDDIALVAALAADPERARALVERELGPLLGGGENGERVRETLLAYLVTGESHVRAAERLGVHEKTVTYRVRGAEERLGRRVAERRGELEAALLLHPLIVGR